MIGDGTQREFTFSKARITRLPAPTTGRVEYRDLDQPGLVLRVSATGARTFNALLWINSKRRLERMTIGRFPNVAVDTARQRVRDLIGEVARGGNPADDKRKYLAQSTLGTAFDAYVADRRARGMRAADAMVATWQRWVGTLPSTPPKRHAPKVRSKPHGAVDWTARRVSDIGAREVIELHRAIVAAGRATMANRVQEMLRATFNFAGVDPNPAQAAGKGKPGGVERVPERPRRRYLTRDELPAFMNALRSFDADWRDLFTLLLFIGYRRSAVAAMRWRDVDLAEHTWTVPEERAKNGEVVMLPLSGPAIEVLERRARKKASRAWVFPADSASGHIENPKKAWARLLAIAELEDLRPHDLRRTLGSWMAAAGVTQLAIAQALGHKDPRSANVYTWLHVGAARAAQQVAHAAIAAAAAPSPETPPRRKRR